MKAVQLNEYGGRDVLKVEELPKPVPGTGQVLVKMKATGINPGEASIREGKMKEQWPTKFPSGEGSDFAGVVDSVGVGIIAFKAGDEVIGFTNDRNAHAEYILASAGNVIPKPANVSWEVGGSLFVAGTTAYAAVNAVNLKPGDTVVVSGAAGGVGTIAVQLAKAKGATVIGLASEANHDWLSGHGVVPVAHGGDVAAGIKKAANGKVDAFIDLFGKGYVDMAVDMGVPVERINTIIDFEAAKKHHVKTDGNSKAANAGVLGELASLIDEGKLDIPVAKTYPLANVREAYEELEKRHTRGKIALVP